MARKVKSERVQSYDPRKVGEEGPRTAHWSQTPEGREKLSRAQKKRWRAKKASQKEGEGRIQRKAPPRTVAAAHFPKDIADGLMGIAEWENWSFSKTVVEVVKDYFQLREGKAQKGRRRG